jgi:hypothetical protein
MVEIGTSFVKFNVMKFDGTSNFEMAETCQEFVGATRDGEGVVQDGNRRYA